MKTISRLISHESNPWLLVGAQVKMEFLLQAGDAELSCWLLLRECFFTCQYVTTLPWPTVLRWAKKSSGITWSFVVSFSLQVLRERSILWAEPELGLILREIAINQCLMWAMWGHNVQDLLRFPLITPAQTSAGSPWPHNGCNYTG